MPSLPPPYVHSSTEPKQQQDPVIIIGAGISGLVLAQYLQKIGIPFRIFERDETLTYRGLGWGLSIHWALPTLKALLPQDVVDKLPEAYVDRPAVERGEVASFPFFDLSTGGTAKFATPTEGTPERIRVSRSRFRKLLAANVAVEWGKGFKSFKKTAGDTVTVYFDDGSFCTGSILVACDGTQSRIRRAIFPNCDTYKLPVRVMGLKSQLRPDQVEAIRKLDPIFWQGAASSNDSFLYFSTLDSPNNNDESSSTHYTGQLVFSWPFRPGFLGSAEPIDFPETNAARLDLLRSFTKTWAEPFRSLVSDALQTKPEAQCLQLQDWVPPAASSEEGKSGMTAVVAGRVVLMGDAFHPMVMYRGEGANHAIVDVLDFATHIAPLLLRRRAVDTRRSGEEKALSTFTPVEVVAKEEEGVETTNDYPSKEPTQPPRPSSKQDYIPNGNSDDLSADMATALTRYHETVRGRTRIAVLASRQACLDAHEWARINEKSPLIQRRIIRLECD